MTDEQIINALKKYIECAEGTQIARDVGGTLVISLLQNALDLINRQQEKIEYMQGEREILLEDMQVRNNQVIEQQAEIEKLNVELVGMRGACNSYKMHYDNANAEIEKLKNSSIRANSVEDWLDYCNGLKSEAIKEFADRLKEQAYRPNPYPYIEILTKEDIDDLVKEMVGEDE